MLTVSTPTLKQFSAILSHPSLVFLSYPPPPSSSRRITVTAFAFIWFTPSIHCILNSTNQTKPVFFNKTVQLKNISPWEWKLFKICYVNSLTSPITAVLTFQPLWGTKTKIIVIKFDFSCSFWQFSFLPIRWNNTTLVSTREERTALIMVDCLHVLTGCAVRN